MVYFNRCGLQKKDLVALAAIQAVEIPVRIPFGNDRISAVFHIPEPAGEGRYGAPCAVASHGLASSKESGKYRQLAEALIPRGIALLRFDFLGCGASTGRLSDTTVVGRLDQLRRVVRFLKAQPFFDGRIALMGSSMGGFLSLLLASEEPGVCAAVAWSSPATLRAPETEEGRLRSWGLGDQYFQEIDSPDAPLDLPPGIRRALVVHGSADDVVPPSHAEAIFARLSEPKEMRVIPGGDHSMRPEAVRMEAIRASADWIERFIREDSL